jgi:hypothetical protein
MTVLLIEDETLAAERLQNLLTGLTLLLRWWHTLNPYPLLFNGLLQIHILI